MEKKVTEETQYAQQSVWNFDGAELFLLFQLKAKVLFALEAWNLEEAYRKVRLMRMELDAKMQRKQKKIIEDFEEEIGKGKAKTEKQQLDDMMRALDTAHSVYIKITYPTNEVQSIFYQYIEGFYMELCFTMKKHGLYFREGDDSRLAVLRR
jgi:negative regulator of genetic competence, sporulation and motility